MTDYEKYLLESVLIVVGVFAWVGDLLGLWSL